MTNISRAQGQSGRPFKSLGVGTKLRIAFFCVSAFAIAAAVVGVLALSGIEERQNQVVDKAIPSVIDAQNFADVTALLIAAPVALGAARSIAELNVEANRLADESRDALASLDRFEQRQFATTHVNALRPLFEVLLTNLERRTELTRQHLSMEARELATTAMAKLAADAILATLQPLAIDAYADLLDDRDRLRDALASQGPVDSDAALEIFDEITEVDIFQTERLTELSFRVERLNGVIDRAALANDPDGLPILHRDYNLGLRNLTRLALELPTSPAKDRIGVQANLLHLASDGPDSLFDLRSAHLAINAEIAGLDHSSLGLATRIDEQVSHIVLEAETTIEQATAKARASISIGQAMLVLFAVGAFGVSLIIGWTYVSNRIVRRINRLALAMQELAHGNLSVSVVDHGNDELSEMAGALAIFRANAIQVRQHEKELRKSEERFSRAVEASSAGIWDWEDLSCDRMYWSPAHFDLLGYVNGEVESSWSSLESLLHPDDKLALEEKTEAHFAKREPYDIEIRLRHKSGEYRWFRVTGRARWDDRGRAVSMTGSISDTTERRHIASLLETQAEDLRRSNIELEQFAYVASHDLQEPLRMVSSYCELLRRRYADKLDDDAKEFIGFAVDGAQRMQNLVRDILHLSRVGRVDLQTELTDLNELTKDVAKDLSEMVAESNADVRIENLPNIMVDAGLIRVVLQNLIQNGIKFRTHDRPVIIVSGIQREGEYEISVSDNGIGIEPQYADRIFEIFQRLHTRGEYPGTGLGLALAKRIMQRHGGDIWLDVTAKIGSTFRFTIPNRAEDRETKASHGRVEYSVGGR